jgi:hypothetical protein
LSSSLGLICQILRLARKSGTVRTTDRGTWDLLACNLSSVDCPDQNHVFKVVLRFRAAPGFPIKTPRAIHFMQTAVPLLKPDFAHESGDVLRRGVVF